MSCTMSTTSIMIAFSKLPDPRKPRNQLYPLEDLLTTAILAVLCNCNDYEEIALWAEENLEWLQSLGLCSLGSPSHDTYERFFKYVDPKCFEACFREWVHFLQRAVEGSVVAIDGKTLRNSGGSDSAPIHLVSAFAAENSLVLGQEKAAGKGKELETIQRLLTFLDIKGAVITIDAGGCHKVIVEQICEKGGDYLICLKGNQGCLHSEVVNFFAQAMEVTPSEADCDYWCGEEHTKGRDEKREVWACEELSWLLQKGDWARLRSIVCVKRTSSYKGEIQVEERYFISSLPAHAERQGKAIRDHWGIENRLHWQLDVTYREDLSRVRAGHAAENLSVLRRATLNMLRTGPQNKHSLKKRRMKASLNRKYLLELVGMK